jgi:hypothetical protein
VRIPPDKPENYEGLVLVEEVTESGTTDRYWDTEAAVKKRQAPNCGPCCHERGGILVIGKCERGRVNGEPLSKFVPGLSRRKRR